jgi:predicted transcriptional regulator
MTENDPRTDKMKREMANHFEAYEYEYREDEDTDAKVVYEDDQVIVVADQSGHELNEWASDFDVDRTELSEFFHERARKLTDYDWGYSDPVLFDKLEQ